MEFGVEKTAQALDMDRWPACQTARVLLVIVCMDEFSSKALVRRNDRMGFTQLRDRIGDLHKGLSHVRIVQ